jgi:hypothetical protein
MARIVVGSSNLTQLLLLYPGLRPAMLEQHSRSCRWKIPIKEIEGSEEIIEAGLVLLAMGFPGPEAVSTPSFMLL